MLWIAVVISLALPFVSSTTSPHIPINVSTTAPQHMLPTHQMSCPIAFPNLTLTHFTFNFQLAIFLVIHLFLLPVVLIHDPNFLLILLCPACPIPQAYITCSMFSPNYIIQALSNIHIFYIASSQLLLLPFHSQYASSRKHMLGGGGAKKLMGIWGKVVDDTKGKARLITTIAIPLQREPGSAWKAPAPPPPPPPPAPASAAQQQQADEEN